MMSPIVVRLANIEDALTISDIVRDTIRVSNSKDYPASVIERVSSNFSAEAVRGLMSNRTVWVALIGGTIVGTASLDENTVRTIFVAHSAQGFGVGRRLMETIEGAAREKCLKLLKVPASLTARDFYARLGYQEVREVSFGEERTFLMEKSIN